jgi:YidC/Oxa1 family membrane protein insertase
MIGFFSLNVPAGLTLYWFANNILSTGRDKSQSGAPRHPMVV